MDANDTIPHLVAVGSMLEAAGDKSENVREVLSASLRKLARKHCNDVLSQSILFRKRNLKLPGHHLITILNTMEQICLEQIVNLDGDVVLQLIDYSVHEMTLTTDYLPEIQMPASGILVALGKKHCNEVMEGLLKHFQPGIVPHYIVVHTMGNIATVNVFGIVPFIKATLGTMLPMLGMLRSDAMKQAFSFAIGRFSDAIQEYMVNIDHAPDPTVCRDAFSTEIGIAYDVLVGSWMQCKEPKMLETVLQAIGPMFGQLPDNKVTEQFPRLISLLLGLYRRNVDQYAVSQCLAQVLKVGLRHNKILLEPMLDNLLSVLLDLICTLPDYAQPATVKNHYEVLRCFDTIASEFSDRVVNHLIQQIKTNERERIKALLVVTHLVNSSEMYIKSRIRDLLTALRSILSDPNVKVKRALLKAIVAFAYRGYVKGSNGREFIEFIVKHCHITSIISGTNGVVEELMSTCTNTLYLLASTVPQIESTLWPLCLGFFLKSEHTQVCSTLARCLTHLAAKRSESHGFVDNEEKLAGEVPKPLAVLSRCLALLGKPTESNRGFHIFNFLKNYSSEINKHIKPLWERKIPHLISYLEENDGIWDENIWEDMLLDFLSSTISEVDTQKWAQDLGEHLSEQVELCHNYPTERGMLFKCLALVSCNSLDHRFVGEQIDIVLGSMRQFSTTESKITARAIGIFSRSHLDIVLTKLETIRKDGLHRKSSRLFSFMKDTKQENEIEKVRLTLLMCYGEIAQEAPTPDLLRVAESSVVNWVFEQLVCLDDQLMLEACFHTIINIAECYHQNRNSLNITLEIRWKLLDMVLTQCCRMGEGALPNEHLFELRTLGLKVATHLVKLCPPLTSEERFALLKKSFAIVYLTVVIGATECNGHIEKGAGEICNDIDVRWPQILDSLASLGSLVQELLLSSLCPSTLDEMFTLLEPWLASKSPQQRAASLATLNNILHTYIDNMKFNYEAPSRFNESGVILARIIPRCTDPNMKVRQKALDCVYLVLSLAARYEGRLTDFDSAVKKSFSQLQKCIQTDDPQQLFSATSELGKIICEKLPSHQLLIFVENLINSLNDSEVSSSIGTSVVFGIVLKVKAGEMFHRVDDLLESLIRLANEIHCPQTRNGSIRAILPLAKHHPKAVINFLLIQPLPFDAAVCDCWKVLAQDKALATEIIEQFLFLFSSTPLFEFQQEKMKIAALHPLAAVSAMHNMFSIAAMHDIASQRFPEVFCMFLIAVGCYIGVSPPVCIPQTGKNKFGIIPNRNAYKINPARVAHDAFKAFLLCAGFDTLAESLLHCTHMDLGDSLGSFMEMMPFLVRSVCKSIPKLLPNLVKCLNQFYESNCEPQRITVTSFSAELLQMKANGEVILLESLITSLLNSLTDPSPVVRQLCMRGLSSVSQLDPEIRNRHMEQVLSALMQGLDDSNNGSSIALEAMRGFSQMLQVAEEEHLHSIQGTAALRVKPYLEKENPQVRAAAVQVLGDLAHHTSQASVMAFREQINANLVCLLLHLNDEDQTVIKACKYTLKQVGPLLEAERINSMLQGNMIEGANLYYSEFMTDLSKLMTEELLEFVPFFIMSALSYVKSSWPMIRGNAALFIGLLYGSLPQGHVIDVQIDMVCSRLLQLLRDENPMVRASTAKALSFLFP